MRGTIVGATGEVQNAQEQFSGLWSPKGLNAHVSKSGEICGPQWRNLYLLSQEGGSCPEGLRRIPLGERGQRTMMWHRLEVRGAVGSGEGGGRKGERG